MTESVRLTLRKVTNDLSVSHTRISLEGGELTNKGILKSRKGF